MFRDSAPVEFLHKMSKVCGDIIIVINKRSILKKKIEKKDLTGKRLNVKR